MKLVLIKWLDSHSTEDWEDLEKLKRDCIAVPCRSVGWLLSEENDHALIVPHIAGEKTDNCGPYGSGNMTIPKGAIVSMDVLQEE